MTAQTTNTANEAFSNNPDFARGRADAYDDATEHHPEVVQAHAQLALDFITPTSTPQQRMYTAGYARAALEVIQYHLATKTTQTDKAQKWWARKNGRKA